MGIDGVPDEMTAVQVVEFNKPYVIHKIKTPTELEPYDILVKTAVGSLCHTDNMVREGKFPTKLPCTGSHEGTGIVAAVGSEVKNFKKGDRVMAGIPKGACGKCVNCQGPDDWHQYCENTAGLLGVFVDGMWADYFVADARTSCHVPESLSLISAAPLACAGITIYRALIVTEAKKGDWVAIIGAGGGLGHLGIQMGKAMGFNIVAIDARDEGLELCKKAGATHILDARDGKEAVVKQVQELTGGQGVDAAVNVSEHETSAGLGCAVTKMHGRMVQVAQPPMISVPFPEIIFRDIRLVGTLIAGQEQSQDMLNLCAAHNIHVECNVFEGLDKVPEMVDFAHSGKMKGKAVCVVDPGLVAQEKGAVSA